MLRISAMGSKPLLALLAALLHGGGFAKKGGLPAAGKTAALFALYGKKRGKVKAYKSIAIAFCTAVSFGSCGEGASTENSNACALCENKERLSEEPAYVSKGCFEHIGRVDAFYFTLVNQRDKILNLFPCGEIPQEYKVEGLSVFISGDITNCLEIGGCVEPNIKLAPINVFELEAIKSNMP